MHVVGHRQCGTDPSEWAYELLWSQCQPWPARRGTSSDRTGPPFPKEELKCPRRPTLPRSLGGADSGTDLWFRNLVPPSLWSVVLAEAGPCLGPEGGVRFNLEEWAWSKGDMGTVHPGPSIMAVFQNSKGIFLEYKLRMLNYKKC